MSLGGGVGVAGFVGGVGAGDVGFEVLAEGRCVWSKEEIVGGDGGVERS